MRRTQWCAVLLAALAGTAGAQTLTRQNLAGILGFENNTSAGALPAGWSGNRDGTVVTDNQVVHSGKYSARIERTTSSAGTFSTLTAAIPVDFGGRTIDWQGYIKGQNVASAVALWIREDDASGSEVQFASLQSMGVNGTFDWTEYGITIPWDPTARMLYFGFLVVGSGKAWVDDLHMFVDGVPVAQAPVRPTTPNDTDHQFDKGSGIKLSALSDAQIANLATLAKVWGFLKYHHPAVTTGQRQWDYDLFRIMPQVLSAADPVAANAILNNWVAGVGPVPDCSTCATLDTSNLALGTNVDWLSDESLLGHDLSQRLLSIYRNRIAQTAQFYVSLFPGVGNPSFDNELQYSTLVYPDTGFQLLALFRFWNMVQYFYPNRQIIADDPASQPAYWNQVLLDSIPAVGLAPDGLTYQQELLRFIGKIHDTHANLWSSLAARPPVGPCYLPVNVRFVEGSALVTDYTSATLAAESGLMQGDVIQQLDGSAVPDLIAKWTPFYDDSNQAARLRDIAEYLTRGPCGLTQVQVQRGNQTVNLTPGRVDPSLLDFSRSYVHDLSGATFQMLTPDVAYLKLSSVVANDSASYVQAAAGTKGIIIDIRNYPNQFVVFTLGDLLASHPVNFAQFTEGDTTTPGAFHWTEPIGLTPQQPHYAGKVVVLVDEETQSQAEYTTMAFRAAGAFVIGSTTAGADGNVSTVTLPGGLSSYISGIGVFYPNGLGTQRVGIIPDIVVTPTIAALQAGRDELIEEAMRVIEGEAPRARRVKR